MAIKIHHLRPAPGAHTAEDPRRPWRGLQGQDRRARDQGHRGAPNNVSGRFEGGQTPLHMRLPKLSGFKNRNKVVFQVVNLDRIAALFPKGGPVNPDTPGRRRRGAPRPPGEGPGPGELSA